jgi:hypothetical protein
MNAKKPNNKPLPEFLRKYFWDADFDKIDPEKYPHYLVERILEYGDKSAVKWMTENFKKSEIKKTLMKKKGISPKSAAYWALIFGVPRDKILCLKKSYQKMKASHWPY